MARGQCGVLLGAKGIPGFLEFVIPLGNNSDNSNKDYNDKDYH